MSKTKNNPYCLPVDERLNKMWYIYTIKYYLAINWYQIFIYAKSWMNIEDITFSERSQTEKVYTLLLYSVDLFKIDNP